MHCGCFVASGSAGVFEGAGGNHVAKTNASAPKLSTIATQDRNSATSASLIGSLIFIIKLYQHRLFGEGGQEMQDVL